MKNEKLLEIDKTFKEFFSHSAQIQVKCEEIIEKSLAENRELEKTIEHLQKTIRLQDEQLDSYRKK